MRYAGPDNFTGGPVPGYGAPQCWLRADAARALAAAQADANAHGFDACRLRLLSSAPSGVGICGLVEERRPANQAKLLSSGQEARSFAKGYIAEKSTHTTGLAVDLGVKGWDFGTPFDFFDRCSWTKANAPKTARAHRDTLVALMQRHGFENYPREWWHYTFKGAKGAPSYDVEIE